MSRAVLLDTGVLGMLTHPRVDESLRGWLSGLLDAGVWVLVPEIADYELRRELTRAGRRASLERLDHLATRAGYLPLTTTDMRRAAVLWAEARNTGRPAAPDEALDGDVILAAQAFGVTDGHTSVVVATTNPKHLSLFVDARRWDEID